MAAVYVNNLIINAGTNFSQIFTLESSDTNSTLNLTGYIVESQMRKYAGSSTALSFSALIISPETSGRIIISLSSLETNDLKPGRYVYDVIISKDSTRTRVIEGMVLVRDGVTR